jgi:peptide/nickel transport system permease protein
VIAVLFGIVVGGIAGIAAPLPQMLLMRVVDVILSFPILLLAIALLVVTTPNLPTIILIIGIAFGAYLSRIVFAQAVSLREREFVLAARATGVRSGRILFRHIVPHVAPSMLVGGALGIAAAIQLEATFSYVGIGLKQPEASWGNMISAGQDYIGAAPWLVIAPGVAIMIALAAFSLLGDALRDALDPSLERRTRLLGIAGVR